jgi:hypothetical protein
MQGDQNVTETTLRKPRSGWLYASINGKTYLMTLFLDFVLFNMYTTDKSCDCMFRDSTKVPETTAVFYCVVAVERLQSRLDRGMRIFSSMRDSLSSPRAA